MATTDDSLLEVLLEIRAMSDKFEELRHHVDILKGRSLTSHLLGVGVGNPPVLALAVVPQRVRILIASNLPLGAEPT